MSKVFFREMEFEVSEGVYEPREDSYLAAEYLWNMDIEGKKVLEIGTGSGFLSVISARKGAEVDAVDINPEALNDAERNAEDNNVEIKLFRSDLFEKVEEKYDMIIFNAPYLPGKSEDQNMEEKAWEGGEGGREVLDRFIKGVGEYMKEDGKLLIVQSSITGEEETIRTLEEHGLRGEIRGRKKVPWEELQLIEACKF